MKSAVKHRFSAAASTYDQYADLQRYVAENLIQRIISASSSPSPDSILEVGCGTGYLTEKIRDLYPASSLIGIDIAAGMVNICRQRCSNGQYIVADGEHLPFHQSFDLIISNLCLQWFRNPTASLPQLVSLGKNVALSTFGSQSFQEWHEVCREYDLPIRTQKLLSINELSFILGSNYSIESQLIKKSFASWGDFWRQIRKIGAGQGVYSISSPSLKNLKKVLSLKKIEVTHEIIFIRNL